MEPQDVLLQENRKKLSVQKIDLIFLFWGKLVPIL
jgi:hypothetical protein